jgi:hypothetical protein
MLLETAEAIKANVWGGERAASRSSHRCARAMGGVPRSATRDQRGARGKAALCLRGRAALFSPPSHFATRLVPTPRGVAPARRNAFFIASDYGNARRKFRFFSRHMAVSLGSDGAEPIFRHRTRVGHAIGRARDIPLLAAALPSPTFSFERMPRLFVSPCL